MVHISFRTNPLGLKGVLAKRYGELVHDLWNGGYRSIAPVKLRVCLFFLHMINSSS